MDIKAIDQLLFEHAHSITQRSQELPFEEGYTQGKYQFCEEGTFVLDLIHTYKIALNLIDGQWLAQIGHHSAWANHPNVAACLAFIEVKGLIA